MEENNFGGDIVIKIMFGFVTDRYIKKGYRFSKTTTISEVINKIIQKEKLGEIRNEIGLFKASIGWLDPKMTLSSYDIKYEVNNPQITKNQKKISTTEKKNALLYKINSNLMHGMIGGYQ